MTQAKSREVIREVGRELAEQISMEAGAEIPTLSG